MTRPEVFLDSSALFAGIVSEIGASRALLMLSEAGIIRITVSEQVIAETERNLARKVTGALPYYRQALRAAGLQIVRDPLLAEVAAYEGLTSHRADIPILVVAIKAQTDFLVTLNRKHFIDDPEVAFKAGIRIGTPGAGLAWVRSQLDTPRDREGR
jgi:predicted nucleic acid-binding protein